MDATEFKRQSYAVWQSMAAGWDQRHAYFEEVAQPVTARLLERLAPAPGQTVLDLAAGTGVVGFAAARLVGAKGRVIVSDFSEDMLEAAKSHAAQLKLANVEFRVIDAERMELPSDAVDAVLCRWGYMLMADPAAALAETRRVLRRGGRLSCAVFAAPERNPWAAIPSRVLHEHGHMPSPAAGAPGIFALADGDRLRGLFAAAGFSEPVTEDVPFAFRFASTAEYWEFLTDAAGAIAMVLRRLDDDERRLVRDGIAERAGGFEDADGIEMPAVSVVAAAS